VKKILDYDWSVFYGLQLITAALRYSLPVLKIYSARNVYYRFSVLAVNIGTQPRSIAQQEARFNSFFKFSNDYLCNGHLSVFVEKRWNKIVFEPLCGASVLNTCITHFNFATTENIIVLVSSWCWSSSGDLWPYEKKKKICWKSHV